jgi:hypothetical protein
LIDRVITRSINNEFNSHRLSVRHLPGALGVALDMIGLVEGMMENGAEAESFG